MRKAMLAAFLVATCGNAGMAATFTPTSVEQFFVNPGENATLQWTADTAPTGGVAFVVRDYRGSQVASGKATIAGQTAVSVSLRLTEGYYEITFPATGQQFGIVASLPQMLEEDPFFAIDAAMSWLVSGTQQRQGLLNVLHRSGIGMMRERLGWGATNPAPGQYHWDDGSDFDSLRHLAAQAGVKVLELAHDSPLWMGQIGWYPDDLVVAAQSWEDYAAHWGFAWGGVELWNEPNMYPFGQNLPADQYVALAKTEGFALDKAGAGVPVVGGAFGLYDGVFLNGIAQNGLLNCIDVFSFHTYVYAPEMQGLVGQYRTWLQTNGHAAMPLWITECGQPTAGTASRPAIGAKAPARWTSR